MSVNNSFASEACCLLHAGLLRIAFSNLPLLEYEWRCSVRVLEKRTVFVCFPVIYFSLTTSVFLKHPAKYVGTCFFYTKGSIYEGASSKSATYYCAIKIMLIQKNLVSPSSSRLHLFSSQYFISPRQMGCPAQVDSEHLT